MCVSVAGPLPIPLGYRNCLFHDHTYVLCVKKERCGFGICHAMRLPCLSTYPFDLHLHKLRTDRVGSFSALVCSLFFVHFKIDCHGSLRRRLHSRKNRMRRTWVVPALHGTIYVRRKGDMIGLGFLFQCRS